MGKNIYGYNCRQCRFHNKLLTWLKYESQFQKNVHRCHDVFLFVDSYQYYSHLQTLSNYVFNPSSVYKTLTQGKKKKQCRKIAN